MMQIRQFEQADAKAVVALDSWAMRDAGTEPTDIPGHDDVTRIAEVYLERGGAFLVGVLSDQAKLDGALGKALGEALEAESSQALKTRDGYLAGMGGVLPNENGYGDERTVPESAELHRMRIAPPVQGQGYGGQLLAALESIACEKGFRVLLATTATRQVRACAFYPAHGYTRVGPSQYGDYELVHFEKSLE